MIAKVEIRKIEEGIAKWRAEQRRKKVIVLYLYIPAMVLLSSTALLRVFCPPLRPISLVLGVLMLATVICYSYNAFWRDKTANVLLKRLEKMKKREEAKK